jgi:hypothetical protein
MQSNAFEEEEYANLRPQELERLDTLVSEYLVFRSFKQTQQQLFLDKRSPASKLGGDDSGSRNRRAIIQRILNALDSGDYPRCITLWDTYISQKIGTVKSMALNTESREAEFLYNLACGIYPFRSHVIKEAGSPDVASKVAARSMTMFKHYVQNRGIKLVQNGEEFSIYKNLFKIAFPPAHPQYSHLFSEEWYNETREKIIKFLEKFFTPENEPVLCQLYTKLNTRTENELKSIFRRRERKLLRFSRSILSLSSDLLNALEDGKTVGKQFLVSFRQKFDSFQDVLRPDKSFDDDMKGDGDAAEESPRGHGGNKFGPRRHSPQGKLEPIGKGSRGNPSPIRSPFKSPNRNNNRDDDDDDDDDESHGIALSTLAHKVKQRFDGKVLEYDIISKDIVYVLHQVGDEVEGLLTRGTGLSQADAVVICQTAMQGTVLLQGLNQYILRQDKDIQSDADRNSAVLALTHSDILSLRKSLKGNFISEYGSDGISLASRSITRYFSLLSKALKRITPYQPSIAVANGQTISLPPYERLLTAAEIVAEYLCRLTSSIGTSRSGLKYLHTSGVHLTIGLTTFLVSLPLPDIDPTCDVYLIRATGHSMNRASSIAAQRSKCRSGPGVCSWCIMALITLVSDCKPHQLGVIKNDGILWITTALSCFVSNIQQALISGDPEDIANSLRETTINSSNSNTNRKTAALAHINGMSPGIGIGISGEKPDTCGSLLDLSLSLLNIILSSADAQRSLVSSLTKQRETESLVSILILLLIRNGIAEEHCTVILTLLKILLLEVTTLDSAKLMPEVLLLKTTLEDGLQPMSIDNTSAQELLNLIFSEYNSSNNNIEAVNCSEILTSVWAAQVQLPENTILKRYIGGAVSGVSFLMRYSTRGSAPQPLFDSRWEPETQMIETRGQLGQQNSAVFNDKIPVTHENIPVGGPGNGPHVPAGSPPKNNDKGMRSRPRLMRTPPDSQIPVSEDHGMELPEEGDEEEEDDDISSEFKKKDDGDKGNIDDSDNDDENDDEEAGDATGNDEEEEEEGDDDEEEEDDD